MGVDYIDFRVGTCAGLYYSTEEEYIILAITNDSPGNGHFEDVLEWFYASCIRDRKNLVIQEISNVKFKTHLLEKREFQECDDYPRSVMKYYVTMPEYKHSFYFQVNTDEADSDYLSAETNDGDVV